MNPNGNGENVVRVLYQRALNAAARLPEWTQETPDQSLLAFLLAAMAANGNATLADLNQAVENYERDVQRRVNGGAS